MITIDESLDMTLHEIGAHYDRLSPNQLSDDWHQFEPATDEDIDRLEERLDLELPNSFRAFLQTNTTRHPFSGNFECLDCDGIIRNWEVMTDLLDDGKFEGYVENRRGAGNWADGVIREVWWSRRWIPISADSVGNLMCIDLDPGEKGRVGQIMNMEVQDGQGPFATRYSSFESYLTAHLGHLRFGNYRVNDEWLEVDEYEAPPAPATDGPERIFVYRPDELPPELTSMLPASAGPRECLFWLAGEGSPTVAALMAIPEPDIDHVDEGMRLASRMSMVAARSRKTARALRPKDVANRRPQYAGTYSFGFHTASASVVEEFLDDANCIVESIVPVVDELLIMRVTDESGAPLKEVELTKDGEYLPTVGIGDGFFIRESPAPFYGPYVLEADGRQTSFDCLPARGVVSILV